MIFFSKIGVVEAPTLAEMEDELSMLPKNIDLDGNTKIDYSINKPEKRFFTRTKLAIIGIAIVIIIIGIIICCCCCCCCQSEKHRFHSDTSMVSDIS